MRSLLVCLLFAGSAALDGCKIVTFGRTATDSPKQAFERLKAALLAKDWEAVYDVAASPSTRKRFDADLEKVKRDLIAKGGESMFAESVLGVSKDEYLRMNARDLFVKSSEASGKVGSLLVMIPDAESMLNSRIVDTKIDGDEAALTAELRDGRRVLELFRENGRWYFQLLDVD